VKAPPGSEIGIYYDGAAVEPGDALQTPTGRLYLVVAVRRQARGRHVGRQHLRAVVAEPPVPEGVRVLPIYWYRRRRSTAVVSPARAAARSRL
jgi:hypothetical protein